MIFNSDLMTIQRLHERSGTSRRQFTEWVEAVKKRKDALQPLVKSEMIRIKEELGEESEISIGPLREDSMWSCVMIGYAEDKPDLLDAVFKVAAPAPILAMAEIIHHAKIAIDQHGKDWGVRIIPFAWDQFKSLAPGEPAEKSRVLTDEDIVIIYDALGLEVPRKHREKVEQVDAPNTPPGFRSDWSLIKQLAQSRGEAMARAWRNLPLLYVGDVLNESVDCLDQIRQDVPELTYLPWNDVVIDTGYFSVLGLNKQQGARVIGPDGKAEGIAKLCKIICRVASPDSFFSNQEILNPWQPLNDEDRDDECLYLTLHAHFIGTFEPMWMKPMILRIKRRNWWKDGSCLIPGNLPEPAVDGWTDSSTYLSGHILTPLAYLTQTPKMLVEQRPRNSGQNRGSKAGKDRKPWTTPMPTILLIDPLKIPAPRSEPKGTGISRFVRARRGGRVILRHPRYYQWPHSKQYVDEQTYNAPPLLDVYYYQTRTFVCGIERGADDRIRVFSYSMDQQTWREVRLRITYRSPFEWTGPNDGYEAHDGHIYRVLKHEMEQRDNLA